MEKKNTILLSNDDYEPVKGLTIDQKGRMFDAIFNYSISGDTDVDDDIEVAFLFFKQRIDRHNEAYEKTCAKRREAGEKGGKRRVEIQANPSKSKQMQANASKCKQIQANPSKPKQTQADKDKDKDRDRDRMFSNENEEKETIPPNGVIKEKKPAVRFVPPTIEEVTAFFAGKGSPPSEAERFWNFYESKGWMVGKNRMQKWKSAAANWANERRDRASPPKELIKSPIPEYSDEEWNALPFWEQDDAIHKHYGLD